MTALARTTAWRKAATGGRAAARPARRAAAALLSAAVLTGIAGCSSSSAGQDGADPGVTDQSGTATAAQPGKYQTLPEPCGSVNRATLTAVLPQASGYAGTPALTYDTDRRVGCRWNGAANGASRTLVIDIERVVSYDNSVSDDDKAHEDFTQRADAAHVPAGTPEPDATLGTPQPSTSGAPATGGPGGTPRRISGIGDEAYLDDSLHPSPGGHGRDVTFVFRAANVLVTVELSQPGSPAADSDLQLDVNQVALELAKAITSLPPPGRGGSGLPLPPGLRDAGPNGRTTYRGRATDTREAVRATGRPTRKAVRQATPEDRAHMFSRAADQEPISAPRTVGAARAGRVPLLFVCAAAVPAALLTGCSSGTAGTARPTAAPSSGTPQPTAAPKVRYATLPAPCLALSAKTVSSLVPGAKKGTVAAAGEPKEHGGCSWSGLSGYQYRFLDAAFQRFDNVAGGLLGDDQAASAYTATLSSTVAGARSAKGTPTTATVTGIGDAASLVTWTDTTDHTRYLNATVVARSANAVLTVDLVGAGMQGAGAPKAADLSSDVEKAAKEALASLG